MIKLCSICDRKRPTDAFIPNKYTADGLQAQCFECEQTKRLLKKQGKKICFLCKEIKYLNEFKQAGTSSRISKYCTDCKDNVLPERNKLIKKDTGNKHYQENKERIREAAVWQRLVIRYGVTQEMFEDMMTEQDGRCSICNELPNKNRLHVDHNHTTGEVRGLLCTVCNTRLGILEIKEWVDKAYNYLYNNDSSWIRDLND